MRVLITGGAGFIGANLVRLINEANPSTLLRVVDDLSTGFESNLQHTKVEFIKDSILNYQLLSEACAGCDAVVHLAALGSVPRSIENPRRSHEVNITGTLNVLEAARHQSVRQVIVASSSSVYGSNTVSPKTERSWTAPMSPYAVTKLATEGYAGAYTNTFGLNTLSFRFFNVYGPLQRARHVYAAVIPKFIDAILNDGLVPVHGDGLQSRDFTYVDTVSSVIHSALLRNVKHSGPVNLAYGSSTSLNGLLRLLHSEMRRDFKIDALPGRTGDVRNSQSDGVLVRELFPDINPVPLAVGLSNTVSWMSSSSVEEYVR